jgi:hypothetical protein
LQDCLFFDTAKPRQINDFHHKLEFTTTVYVLLDKAAQTGVESSPKPGVMQADREFVRTPAPRSWRSLLKVDLYSSSRTSLVCHLVLLALLVLLLLVAIG